MNTNTTHWTSIWGNAVSIAENRPESYSKNITLRYPIYSHFAGEAIRLTFDNYCGTEAITISKTTLLINNEFVTVTFDQKPSVTIPAGVRIVSDEIACEVVAKSIFFVSFYLEDYTQMRSMVYASGPLSTGIYAVSDCTMEKDIPINISRNTNNFYFLSNVSVLTKKENRCIVCYGDSITAQDWPNYLALEFNDWMRTTDLVDGCIDFDKALCDPDNPSAFLSVYDSGDHLHPSKEGYKKMAETVMKELLY